MIITFMQKYFNKIYFHYANKRYNNKYIDSTSTITSCVNAAVFYKMFDITVFFLHNNIIHLYL